MRIEGKVDIERPAREVFDYLADVRNEREWHPAAVVEMSKVSDDPVRRGTVFRGEYRRFGTLETTIEDYDRPRHLAMRASGRKIEISAEIDIIEGDDERSRVRLVGDFELRGILRLFLPLISPVLRSQYRRDLCSLKLVLESRRQAA